MSDTVVLGKDVATSITQKIDFDNTEASEDLMPSYPLLQQGLTEARNLVDDIVLKNYLNNLTELEIRPLDKKLQKISDIRMFKITEMVYQNNEYSTYKFASVFNAVQSLKCGVFILVNSNGSKTDFYMGVRNLDNCRTTDSLNSTLKNALVGQFPGVKTERVWDEDAEEMLKNLPCKNIAMVSCVAQNKDEEFNDNSTFIQGLEKLALAMQGQSYTAIVLAKSSPADQLNEIRYAYETIYTQLLPFADMQLSYGTNKALSISDAFSHGETLTLSHSTNISKQRGTANSKGTQENHSVTKVDSVASVAKALGSAALGVASLVTAPLTGGASFVAAGSIMAGQIGLNAINPKSTTEGSSTSENYSENESESRGETFSESKGKTENTTHSEGITTGISDNVQLTLQNKSLDNTLERINLQLKRIEECESIGMWECAAYFLSESQETTEMAAGTYKALMKGERSGVETSAINFWGRGEVKKLPILYEYISNFIHPVFEYHSNTIAVPVTAASLVSSNELAIHMGLPRKSVCGFPVIEHADFGKEIVSYNKKTGCKNITLGRIFNMGEETSTKVKLDSDSLTMHTFISGSTGSGKSNTIYEILNQLQTIYNIPFLIIEPAKGEYKHMFGNREDVHVFGTNPYYMPLLKINPFKFPEDIHVLEHVDRLVEIFNVCWPMYAAMPAVLKDAVLRAYESSGWDLITSINADGPLFPTFADVLRELDYVISHSAYSSDTKGDYIGSLATRLNSLTNGLNGQIFVSDEVDNRILFDSKTIVDLSRVGSLETKALLMGVLVMRLSEHRMACSEGMNQPLRHVTVLEEAHNILKRTSTEQSMEGANMAGKSVEMISNAIAEMRTYGEGFIIADQSPNAIDISAIRNTNTKIIMRLPDEDDRQLAGRAAALKDEQLDEIAKLPKGVAVVYQNDWLEPVLCKIHKYEGQETLYQYTDKEFGRDQKQEQWFKRELLKLLVKGRVNEKIDVDIDKLQQQVLSVNLSTKLKRTIRDLLESYQKDGKLELWQDRNFASLSVLVTDLLQCESKVDSAVKNAQSFDELNRSLANIIQQQVPESSDKIYLTIAQCLMNRFRMEKIENVQIYKDWYENIFAKGVL